MIITSNVLRVAAINSVGDFVLFLGKVGVMAATVGVGILWLKVRPRNLYILHPPRLASFDLFTTRLSVDSRWVEY